MLVFLDTELPDLDEPNLLSIGMVSEAGDEFYAELELDTDDARDRMRVTSDFVTQGPVLSQWGKVPGAACGRQEMGRRAAAWLLGLAAAGDEVIVTSDAKLDFELLEYALRHAGLRDQVLRCVRSEIVRRGDEAASAQAREFERLERERGLAPHHALADALALRAGCSPGFGPGQGPGPSIL